MIESRGSGKSSKRISMCAAWRATATLCWMPARVKSGRDQAASSTDQSIIRAKKTEIAKLRERIQKVQQWIGPQPLTKSMYELETR